MLRSDLHGSSYLKTEDRQEGEDERGKRKGNLKMKTTVYL